jgi:hypothetical protein
MALTQVFVWLLSGATLVVTAGVMARTTVAVVAGRRADRSRRFRRY